MSIYKPRIALVELTVVRKTGLPKTNEDSLAKRTVSLALQGMQYQDPDGDWWEFGTVMHAQSMEAIGRRAVCAEEGHKFPPVVKDKTVGCQRCDYVFFGKAVGDQ